MGCGFIILSGVLVFSIIRGVREKRRCCSNFNMVLRDSRTGWNRQCESWRGSSSQQPLFLTFISRYNGNGFCGRCEGEGGGDARARSLPAPLHGPVSQSPGNFCTWETTGVQRFTVKYLRKSVQAAERWGVYARATPSAC